jgi:hypothetical protein
MHATPSRDGPIGRRRGSYPGGPGLEERRLARRLARPCLRILHAGDVVHVLTRAARPAAVKLVLDGGLLAVLARPSPGADVPDRLEVYAVSSGRLLHDWPLLARPRTLSLSGGIAVFAAAGGRGLYAIRLSDGRQTLVSPIRRKDVPQIGARGLVYESSLMRRMRRPDRFVLKFAPSRALNADLRATVDRLRTRWPITSFTMDGQRVGVVLNAPGQACDQVHYLNIPWHYFARINMPDDLTCARHMSIRSLSLGGLTSEWVAVRDHVARVVMSNSIACIERVIATGAASGRILLAGDRGMLGLGRLPGSTLATRSSFDPVTKAVVADAAPAGSCAVRRRRSAREPRRRRSRDVPASRRDRRPRIVAGYGLEGDRAPA